MRLLIPLVLSLVASTAAANDSSFGGNGADLVPLEETRIRMVSEDIVLSLQTDPVAEQEGDSLAWVIHARYRFANPTAETVRLQMGFPESRCDGEGDCTGRGGEFRDMVTKVRGETVAQRVGRVERPEEWPGLGRVFVYDLSFAPNETVEVEHHYVYDRSRSVMGDHLFYLTQTGRNWNGPIGHARFTVRTPYAPWLTVAPSGYEVTEVRETPSGDSGGVHELVFEARDWTPEEDFAVFLVTVWPSAAMIYGFDDCPLVYGAEEDDFADLDAATLAVCRAAVHAHHGKVFDDPALTERFYGDRAPTEEERMFTAGMEDASIVRLRPNPAYAPSLLTAEERRYDALASAALGDTEPTAPPVESAEPSEPAVAQVPPAGGGGCAGCATSGTPNDAFFLLIALFGLSRLRQSGGN